MFLFNFAVHIRNCGRQQSCKPLDVQVPGAYILSQRFYCLLYTCNTMMLAGKHIVAALYCFNEPFSYSYL